MKDFHKLKDADSRLWPEEKKQRRKSQPKLSSLSSSSSAASAAAASSAADEAAAAAAAAVAAVSSPAFDIRRAQNIARNKAMMAKLDLNIVQEISSTGPVLAKGTPNLNEIWSKKDTDYQDDSSNEESSDSPVVSVKSCRRSRRRNNNINYAEQDSDQDSAQAPEQEQEQPELESEESEQDPEQDPGSEAENDGSLQYTTSTLKRPECQGMFLLYLLYQGPDSALGKEAETFFMLGKIDKPPFDDEKEDEGDDEDPSLWLHTRDYSSSQDGKWPISLQDSYFLKAPVVSNNWVNVGEFSEDVVVLGLFKTLTRRTIGWCLPVWVRKRAMQILSSLEDDVDYVKAFLQQDPQSRPRTRAPPKVE